MKIINRLTISFIIMGLFLVFCLSVFIYTIVNLNFNQLENSYIERNVNRVKELIDDKIANLDILAKDWAYWNDLYAYTTYENPEFTKGNLIPENFSNNMKIDMFIIVDYNGNLVYSWDSFSNIIREASGNALKKNLPPPFIPSLISLGINKEGISGLVVSVNGNQFLTLAVRPILHSDETGPVAGYLIMGRDLSTREINDIEKLSKLEIKFEKYDDKTIQDIKRKALNLNNIFITKQWQTTNNYFVQDDIFGQKALIFEVLYKRDIYQQGVQTFYSIMLIIVILTVVLAIFMFIFNQKLFGDLLSRIYALKKASESIIDDKFEVNNNSYFAILNKNDELGELAQSFEKMRMFIKQTNANLQNLVAQKTKEVEEKLAKEEKTTEAMLYLLERSKKTNIALQEKERLVEKANRDLIKLDRLKNDFLSNVNHELRTPLTSIKMYNQMLYDEDLGSVSPEQKDALKEILEASDHLLEIIKNILAFKKLEDGKTEFVFSENKMDEVVDSVNTNLKAFIQESAVEVNFVGASQIPVFKFDKIKIIEALQNLISNAIKYNRDHNPIKVVFAKKIEKTGEFCEIQVIDHGVGIKPENQKNLFKKFYRVESNLTQTTEGTGLGLSITKDIILAHKGEIMIKSKYGEGTTFIITLPMR
ncbi:hypothetical protein GYA19_03720 [Candidatus Beckwithbacteria bacterium]|nr:hypothetical protein [Candidatus Beckwithbacteria bacterium]